MFLSCAIYPKFKCIAYESQIKIPVCSGVKIPVSAQNWRGMGVSIARHLLSGLAIALRSLLRSITIRAIYSIR